MRKAHEIDAKQRYTHEGNAQVERQRDTYYKRAGGRGRSMSSRKSSMTVDGTHIGIRFRKC